MRWRGLLLLRCLEGEEEGPVMIDDHYLYYHLIINGYHWDKRG